MCHNVPLSSPFSKLKHLFPATHTYFYQKKGKGAVKGKWDGSDRTTNESHWTT